MPEQTVTDKLKLIMENIAVNEICTCYIPLLRKKIEALLNTFS